MLKSDSSPSKWNIRTLTARIPFLRVLAAFLVLLPAAFAQDFTLSDSPFFPTAVTPGGTASSNISVGTTGNFTGDVTLSLPGLAAIGCDDHCSHLHHEPVDGHSASRFRRRHHNQCDLDCSRRNTWTLHRHHHRHRTIDHTFA